ncbi:MULTISPECIES: flagellar basal body rod protein FlgC [Azospirillaceae]|uniref:flagellar basal body rod protein FlgC n=1 Tax=Azospirillaceae TaxID=2829815 RepID=UPI000B6EB672|nr:MULTISPECIES: flagellar basal body rod protein FlgC [Azospirillaceae]MDG5496374.1 flagellar basal body rod protein FlgC [Niveispirillum sp. BGYR6]SNS73055.1 flagellar basal-body rod protein FlgC [Azospirillum sp. RU38E]SNS90899.1 flagellar basal-body rod protein FlgC [Azospirillum sp. RU37A]
MSIDNLTSSFGIAAAGMKAQATRLRVVAENMANANSTSEVAGGDPYRRKTIVFSSVLDRALSADKVEVKRIGRDESDFTLRYDPSHPAADENGYIKTPNVNSLVEAMDMREAGRSYDANLNVMQQARTMLGRTIDMLRS